jgi:hypothetical protein
MTFDKPQCPSCIAALPRDSGPMCPGQVHFVGMSFTLQAL